MQLTLDHHFYGNSIYVVRCAGMIVAGDSLRKLEETLLRGLDASNRMVVDLRGVDRLDSTGMGMLVRFLTRARHLGGDLRLASPTGFVRKLLTATRLDSVFLIYTSEYNAIASFFLRGAPGEKHPALAGTVLFLEPSDDLCAFARTVLRQHGYEVLTTDSLSDAQLMAQAAQPSVVLVGPRGAETADLPALQVIVPQARTVTLAAGFSQSDPRQAAAALLKAVQEQT